MSRKSLVSVVIPVYNAGPFLTKGLNSVLQFEEVSEVIFVEDGSKDNSLAILLDLEAKYNKVKVYRHSDCANHGAGPSRNLGIEKASSEWIAFLDADDLFLPNRFDYERSSIFKESNSTIDGVYGAIGAHHLSEEAKHKYDLVFTSVSGNIPPNDLKYVLLNMHNRYKGHFSLIALTVRKSLLVSAGGFTSNLALGQDTDMCVKLAFSGQLISGIIDKPVSSRGVHMNNRITKMTYEQHLRIKEVRLKNWKSWLVENFQDEEKAIMHVDRELDAICFVNSKDGIHLIKAYSFFRKRPDIFFDNRKSEMIIKKVFGRNKLGSFITVLKEKIVLIFFQQKVEKWNLYIN